jgi:hypothetical protein
MMVCLLNFHPFTRVIKLLLLLSTFFLVFYSCNASASDSKNSLAASEKIFSHQRSITTPITQVLVLMLLDCQ